MFEKAGRREKEEGKRGDVDDVPAAEARDLHPSKNTAQGREHERKKDVCVRKPKWRQKLVEKGGGRDTCCCLEPDG